MDDKVAMLDKDTHAVQHHADEAAGVDREKLQGAVAGGSVPADEHGAVRVGDLGRPTTFALTTGEGNCTPRSATRPCRPDRRARPHHGRLDVGVDGRSCDRFRRRRLGSVGHLERRHRDPRRLERGRRTPPTAIITAKTSNYNYVQRIRNGYEFTGTDEWQVHYSGNPLAYQRKKIATEHKRDIENQVWFGARSYTAAGAVTLKAQSTFGGIDSFISTNITDAGGTFDKGELQDFLRSGLEYGDPTRKVLFCAPIVAQVCSEFLQDNWITPTDVNTNVFGVKVDFVISGVTGAKIPVIVKNDWKRYGEGTGPHRFARLPGRHDRGGARQGSADVPWPALPVAVPADPGERRGPRR
jgi:hypothetical protein